jgi:hypothetical protein
MHAIMGIVYGAFVATLLPDLLRWSRLPAGFGQADYGFISWMLSLMAVGVFASGLRDVLAVRRIERYSGTAELARI